MPRRRRPRPVDAIGLALAAAFTVWTFVSAAANEGSRPWPTVLAVAAATFAFAGGRAAARAIARSDGSAAAALAGLGGALVAFAVPFDIASSGGPPLGYGNANGALFAALAWAVVAVWTAAPARSRRFDAVAAVLALAATASCLLSGSWGAAATLAVGAAVGALAVAGRSVGVGAPLAGAVIALGTGVVFAIAVGAGPDEPGSDTYGVRVQLWRAAADLAQDEVATGIGPGRFEDETPVSEDADLRRAHSTPLQVAAELGLPGLVLFLALEGWVVAAVWAAGDGRLAAVGAAAFTTTALHATFDWVLAEPAVLVMIAVVVGGASTATRPAAGQGWGRDALAQPR